MTIDIIEEGPGALRTYATVPIAFEVSTVLDDRGLDALRRGEALRAIPVDEAYVKDYDRYPGNHPTEWPARFDVEKWGFFGAYIGTARVGSAAVIMADERIELLQGRSDAALLWDMRVETQQVNVPACRFYSTHGFVLEHVERNAYPELPDELQLLWVRRVVSGAASGLSVR